MSSSSVNANSKAIQKRHEFSLPQREKVSSGDVEFDETELRILMRKSYQVDKSFFKSFESQIVGEGGELNGRLDTLVSEQTGKIHNTYCRTTKTKNRKVARARSSDNNKVFLGK